MSHYQGSVPDSFRATDWRDRGACRETDQAGKPLHHPELFFPVGNSGPAMMQAREAKQVCALCASLIECRAWALDSNIEFGVFGGLTERERRSIKRRHARGRTGMPVEKQPKPATVQELWARRAKPLGGGHFRWSGTAPGRTEQGQFTPMQAAFIIGRGRQPIGRLKRVCEVPACIWHVEDAVERARREQPVPQVALA